MIGLPLAILDVVTEQNEERRRGERGDDRIRPLNQKNTKAVIGQNSKEKSWKEDIPI